MSTLTPRQQAALDFLRQHGPSTRARVAAWLECSENTAGVHLQALVAAGKAWPQRRGAGALWDITKPPTAAIDRRLEQVSSIWAYAARHAAAR